MAVQLPPPPADEYLTPEQVLELREQLLADLEMLHARSHRTVEDLTKVEDQEPDALDIASSQSSREFTLRIADRERRLVGKIRVALNRINEGEYGSCEACGGAIGFGRLRARPVATQCIDCKTTSEAFER